MLDLAGGLCVMSLLIAFWQRLAGIQCSARLTDMFPAKLFSVLNITLYGKKKNLQISHSWYVTVAVFDLQERNCWQSRDSAQCCLCSEIEVFVLFASNCKKPVRLQVLVETFNAYWCKTNSLLLKCKLCAVEMEVALAEVYIFSIYIWFNIISSMKEKKREKAWALAEPIDYQTISVASH